MTTDARTTDLLVQAQYANAALELARIAVPTAFVPDSLKVWRNAEKAKGRDGDKTLANVDIDATVAQVGLAIVKGTSLGFDWIASLEAVVVINNRPFLTAIALRGLIQRTPFLRMEVVETTTERAIVTGWRRGDDGQWGEPQTSVWSMDRARRAKFRGMNYEDSTWRTMPGNMLLARATAEDARLIGADVILGIPYIVEEADSFGDVDTGESQDGAEPAPPGTPALPPPAEPRPPSRSRRRPPPPPAGAGTDNPDAGGTGEPMSVDDQRTEIYSGLARLGITKSTEQRAKVNSWLDTDGPAKITRMTDLTLAQAREVLKRIDAELRRQAQDASTGDGKGAAEDGGDPPAAEPADDSGDAAGEDAKS